MSSPKKTMDQQARSHADGIHVLTSAGECAQKENAREDFIFGYQAGRLDAIEQYEQLSVSDGKTNKDLKNELAELRASHAASNLENVRLGDEVKKLSDGVAHYCSRLTEVSRECGNLKEVMKKSQAKIDHERIIGMSKVMKEITPKALFNKIGELTVELTELRASLAEMIEELEDPTKAWGKLDFSDEALITKTSATESGEGEKL